MSPLPETIRMGAAGLAGLSLLGAAFCDVRSYQIPNRFAVAIVVSFVVLAIGGSPRAVLSAAAVGLGAFGLGLILFARGWLGGGDVKLLAATVLLVPPPLLAPFTMVVSLAGAALALVLLTPVHRIMPAPPAGLMGAAAGGRLRQPMPFAVAIAAGGLFTLVLRVSG